MAYNDKLRDYSIQYAKEKLKRVPLDMRKDEYERTKSAAEAAGESVNGYIKKAVADRIANEANA